MSIDAIWREDATEEEIIAAYQQAIDSGDAWRLEGHVGRTAMGLIEQGLCVLGEEAHRDFWGNRVPSRFEVEPGSLGSVEYAAQRHAEDGER
jgi:hypothetical protein